MRRSKVKFGSWEAVKANGNLVKNMLSKNIAVRPDLHTPGQKGTTAPKTR